jgi:hypothetical protein
MDTYYSGKGIPENSKIPETKEKPVLEFYVGH